MRILYVSQYFPPEIGAPSVRISQLAKHWRQAGCDVRVLTGFPHHPEGVVPAEYRALLRRGFHREDWHGAPVYRTWLYPAANRGVMKRSLSYGSFMLSAAFRGRRLDFEPDIVIGSSPQLLAARAAASIARHFNARFVFEARDLWPESLEAVGVFGAESIVYRSLDALANRLYRQAWRIVVTTDASREAVIAKGRPPEQVAVIRNGVDAELFSPQAAPPPDSAAPSGTFNLVYVGTLGLAHGLESLLDAAALLADHPDIRITLIGGGADRSQLQAQARSKGLRNVVFSGPRPWNEIPGLLAAADAALVHLNNSPLFATVLPSKMFEAMAAGTPVILGVRGEARQILEQADAGIAIEPGNPAQLRDAVLELQRDPKRCARLGRNGRRYALENASYESRARDYLTLLSG